MKKVDILAVGVHPDDVELSCSGTILKHQAEGKMIGLLDLTLGELGTRGNAALRTQEAMNAAEFLGTEFREQLNLGDGFFEHNKDSLIQIIEIIRYCQPEIVLCNAISDRHPDHGRAGKLTADACFFSGLAKIETTFRGEKQTHWRPKAVYHYIQDHQLTPDFVVDITPFMEQKIESMLLYKSQFYNEGYEKEELSTPISGKDFLDFMYAKARIFGRPIGVEFAEGFTVTRTIGVGNLFDIV
jgi:bacillithiol biosynthesis deacetylase BshB1